MEAAEEQTAEVATPAAEAPEPTTAAAPSPKAGPEPGTENDVEVKDQNGDRLFLLRPSKSEHGMTELHFGNAVRVLPPAVLETLFNELGKLLKK